MDEIDFSQISLEDDGFLAPALVPGRVANIDGDFISYHASFAEDFSELDVIENIHAEVANIRLLCGAETVYIHLTHPRSDKGKRHDIACVKQYQVGRKDKESPRLLKFARDYMDKNYPSMMHITQEADDGLCQMQTDFIARGVPDLCVLWSKDKDLRMVPGLHIDPDTGAIVDVQGFGNVGYDSSKSKLTGWGTAFFWAQLLGGDGADDIPGLPKLSGSMAKKYFPTKSIQESERRIRESTMPSGKLCSTKQIEAARSALDNVKPKACGLATAAALIQTCSNDLEAYNLCKAAYREWYGDRYKFQCWRGNELERDSVAMLIEQAVLLWMRREKGAGDVMKFFGEVQNGKV